MNRKRDVRALIVVFVVMVAGMLLGLVRPADAGTAGVLPHEVISLYD
jgi:hypothetical protein